MNDEILNEVFAIVDDLREELGEIVDYDHTDETTKIVFFSRTEAFDPEDLDEVRDLFREECSTYRVGSIRRRSL